MKRELVWPSGDRLLKLLHLGKDSSFNSGFVERRKRYRFSGVCSVNSFPIWKFVLLAPFYLTVFKAHNDMGRSSYL